MTGNTTGPYIDWHILSNGGDNSAHTFSFGRGYFEAFFRDGLTPGYYDGDNLADAAVYRTYDGSSFEHITFYIRPSTLASSNPNAHYAVRWGVNLDRPITGDYDGDGRDEITVIRTYPNPQLRASTYFAGDSLTGALVLAQDWGSNSDIYIIGDYLGDRRADFAVMRNSNSGTPVLNATWYVLENGGNGQIVTRVFGYGNGGPGFDTAVCGDYNGDGKQDIAVYRPADRTFYWLNSPDFNSFSYQQWGEPNGDNYPVGNLHTFNYR